MALVLLLVALLKLPPDDPEHSAGDMTEDRFVQVASTLSASPGGIALLVGSGVSAAASVLTGWDVTLDLIRRLAALEGFEPPDDPVIWYADAHGADPNYSALLSALAPTSLSRRDLLEPYFKASEAEFAAGIKRPTTAHRAIAELVTLGAVRIIVTTNFDRLLEQALAEVGIEPLVISTADAARDAPPIHRPPCVVIKVHGTAA